MYNMVIADDEYLVCEYISHVIHKYHLPIQICGEASNGEEAIRIVEQHQPDFVMLDINMPGIDGLQAAKMIREKNPNIIMYILTAYRQFDYVRDAMHSAVLDYLVKPIKPQDLVNVLQDGIHKALRQRLSTLQQERVDRKIEQQEYMERQQLLFSLLNNAASDEKIRPLICTMSNRAQFTPIAVVCLSYWGDKVQEIEKIAMKYSKKFQDVALGISKGTDITLLFDSWNADIRKKVYDVISTCEKINRISFCVRVTMIHQRPISMAYKECSISCKIGKFWKYADKDAILKYAEKEGCYTETIDLKNVQQELESHVLAHDEQGIDKLIENLFLFMRQHLYSAELVCANVTKIGCNIIGKYSDSILTEVEGNTLEHGFLQNISEAGYAIDVQLALKQIMKYILQKIPVNKNNAEKIAAWAVQYIDDNYAEEITLESIADELFVSTSYLCRVFKKHVGKGYVSYLNDVRMKKAKMLLCSNKYTVAEVAKSVGFRDASYFSSVFKRYYHCPPSAFLNEK